MSAYPCDALANLDLASGGPELAGLPAAACAGACGAADRPAADAGAENTKGAEELRTELMVSEPMVAEPSVAGPMVSECMAGVPLVSEPFIAGPSEAEGGVVGEATECAYALMPSAKDSVQNSLCEGSLGAVEPGWVCARCLP